MIAIIDYGVGNLFSLNSAVSSLGLESCVTKDPEVLDQADRIILPGVGAFGDAAEKLREAGMDTAVKKQAAAGKPLLGICLGMQLLFEKSYEYGEHEGLGLVPGVVLPFEDKIDPDLDVPQIGWNALKFPAGKPKSPLFKYIEEGEYVYFVHSYAAFDCDSSLIASTDYSIPLTAAVQNGNVFGTQFHPEKSGDTGARILKAFAEVTA